MNIEIFEDSIELYDFHNNSIEYATTTAMEMGLNKFDFDLDENCVRFSNTGEFDISKITYFLERFKKNSITIKEFIGSQSEISQNAQTFARQNKLEIVYKSWKMEYTGYNAKWTSNVYFLN